MKKLVILLSVLLIAVTGPAFAQSTTGTIQVIVTDSSGAPLPGVTVTASAADTNTRRTEVTGTDGVATLVSLQPSNGYVVETSLEGFGKAQNTNVLVRSAQTASVRVTLQMASVSESITVTADAPIVDTTSATVGQELTLELTESLPTGRSYQSYLQLVPGVLPSTTGNPASRSGMNYSDIGGSIGQSTDNFYYVEGINVTDPSTGTFGANLNTEIIQEQKVLTGGIPAEFAGAPGLLSSVVTKSGSNNFTGSVNYYTQNSSLVAENENEGSDAEFSTFDSAVTLGGPIVRDKAWFFGSYRITDREDDVTNQDTNQFLRTVTNEGHQAFGKLSWQITSKDRLSGTYTDDPTDISGSTSSAILNNRDRATKQGGPRYVLDYSRVFSANFLLDAAYGQHDSEVSQSSTLAEDSNTVYFRSADGATLAQRQLGGFGTNTINERDTDFMKASVEGIFDTGFGSHTVKFGAEREDHINFRDTSFVNDAAYASLGSIYVGEGITAGQLSDESNLWTGINFDVFNSSDFDLLIGNIDASADKAFFYGLLDANHDGTITAEEAGAGIVFNSTAGNPHGQVNYYRNFQTAAGPQETKTEGTTFYLQDTIQWGSWAFNVGVRTEKWEHVATTGENIYTFDWTYAPRLSAIYDIGGQGRQKVSAYYGRYYDPIRLNMTNFAGTLTGRITDEQVFIGDRWVTYRTRGGPVVQDAFFSPTTKTPYTDELQLSYQLDLGRNMSIETTAFRRQTRDILEDYDLHLYADPDGYCGAGKESCINDPDSLFLGYDYFGYTANPGSNFVIGTLAGGERNTDGIDLVFRKRYANNWQGLMSYTFTDAKGNTNSDSNADFQGDVLFLDPRAPNQYGRQPGSISHLLKLAGSYRMFNHLEVGGVYNWNSGSYASRTFLASSRNLPIRVLPTETFEFGGVTTRWIAPNTIGALENPSYGTLDLRGAWTQPLPRSTSLELFLDIFNVLNDQAVTREQDLVAGSGSKAFGDPISWVEPRRFYLGARFLF